MSAVNEMETMFRNSFLNKIKDVTMIADQHQTKPRIGEKRLVREHSSLGVRVRSTGRNPV